MVSSSKIYYKKFYEKRIKNENQDSCFLSHFHQLASWEKMIRKILSLLMWCQMKESTASFSNPLKLALEISLIKTKVMNSKQPQ